MKTLSSFKDELFSLNHRNFNAKALELFRFQSSNNKTYNAYLRHLSIKTNEIKDVQDIPFLPIEFFKTHKIKTGKWQTACTFKSSGTTGSVRSSHEVEDESFYLKTTKFLFEKEFGSLEDIVLLALLPNYIEQGDSSLISMVNFFIKTTKSSLSGFYSLDSIHELKEILNKSGTKKILLIGVSYALLELCEKIEERLDYSNLIVMETGGMKGRRREITREELHNQLKNKLGVKTIYSEYGMTELLSQAYSSGHGNFNVPSTMKILIRDINDPFTYLNIGETGAINIVDMANVHSIAFIETKDLGKINADGTFQVLGRMDNSDIRGCNLLMQ